MLAYLLRILKAFWLPILLLAIILGLLARLTNISDQQSFNIILGIGLGVVLGFIADISKRSLDDFQNDIKLRNSALKLLGLDAKRIYQTMSLYDGLMKMEGKVAEHAKKQVPPPLGLKYWSRLSQSNAFLLLAGEAPFDQIFSDFWEMDNIDDLIHRAVDHQDREAAKMAMGIYILAIQKQHHRQILLHFMSENEIEEMEKKSVNPDEADEKTVLV